jgi:hypothetical protein
MKFTDRVNYQTIMRLMHSVLRRANIGVDFEFPDRNERR